MATHGESQDQQKKIRRIKQIAERIIGLPTLPTVVAKMIELVDNPKTSASSLAKLISSDQALTAKILKLANSAYYGFPREISTVNLAIVVLGFNTVKDMGLSVSVLDAFTDMDDIEHFEMSRFWEHSIGVGVAAKMLAHTFEYRVAGEAFVAGLLHDVGKLILNQYLHSDFLAVLKKANQEKRELKDVEIEIIGATHAQVGAWLAERWRLPRMIVDSIEFHHRIGETNNVSELVFFTYLADFLCRRAKIGTSGNGVEPTLTPEAEEILKKKSIPFSQEDIDILQMNFLVEFEKAQGFIDFIREPVRE
ncbi:MAG: HDOD domain-containing protein [Elusimicrobiota bacterium]